MKTETLKTNKVQKARNDLVRILVRYRVTLPEVMGVVRSRKGTDDKIWNTIKADYERIQEKIFRERYPDLLPRPPK